MRTYQSKEKKEKKMSKKTLLTVLSSCAIIVIALAITLPLALAGSRKSQDPEPEPVPTVKPISFVMPIESYTVGMEFNISELLYSSTLNQWRTHSGTDFLAAAGTAVGAIADGTVTEVKSTTLDGYVVTITHKDGFVSVYKSLGEKPTVVENAEVSAGDKIGIVGTSMITEQAEGPHLHLELTKSGKLVDPFDHLPYEGDK